MKLIVTGPGGRKLVIHVDPASPCRDVGENAAAAMKIPDHEQTTAWTISRDDGRRILPPDDLVGKVVEDGAHVELVRLT